jgi:hypothetical protein
MLRSPRPSCFLLVRGVRVLVVVAALGLAGCAAHRPGSASQEPSPAEVYRAIFGRNPGLTSVRAVAEARLSFAGREVSLPGVLLLDSLGGFRLDLLDPLDRPLAILFAAEGRVVHYRPGPGLAASLGVFPAECRGVDPADWVSALLSSQVAPAAGERLVDRGLWLDGRVLERHRGGELQQSSRYAAGGALALPRLISWYCGEEPVLQVRLLDWTVSSEWRLPSRFEIDFPRAGLVIGMELGEIEGNPPPSGQPFRPPLGSEIRWTTWNLPK